MQTKHKIFIGVALFYHVLNNAAGHALIRKAEHERDELRKEKSMLIVLTNSLMARQEFLTKEERELMIDIQFMETTRHI